MIEYLRRNGQFAVLIITWILAGMVAKELGILAVTISVILLKRKDMFPELISGFALLLVLSDSFLPSLTFAKDAKSVYLLLLAFIFLFNRKEFTFKLNFFIPFIPFFIWAALMLSRSPNLNESIPKTLSYILLFLVGPSYIMKIFHERGTAFIRDHVFLMSYMLLAGLIMFVVANEKVIIAERFTGVMGNPNGIGLFCTVFFLLFQSAVIKFPDLFTRNEKIVVYLLIALSVLLSGSRNTILSIGIFLFFTRFYKISPILGAGIVVAMAIVYQVVVSNLTEILQGLGLAKALRADTLESGSGRLVAWAFGWKFINSDISQFFLGRGFGFDEYLYIINKAALNRLGHIGGVHNSYLALWINTGLVGLILWITGFVKIFIMAIKKSYTALPLAYAVLFSATFEAWLMGSLNPHMITLLFILTMISTDNSAFAGQKSLPETELKDHNVQPVLK
jgi:O-antigen ligase